MPGKYHRPPLLRLLCLALISIGAVLGLPERAVSQALEYEVKAAFLLNFTKFIDWPASAFRPGEPFSICILGTDPFGRSLDEIVAGETVNGRKVVIRRINGNTRPDGCQIVFFGNGSNLAENSLGRGVLTVGDAPDFLRQGGMIAFALENHRVRFDINQPAAEKAGLKLSSKLLSVARSVKK